jgi:hypothetical protein
MGSVPLAGSADALGAPLAVTGSGNHDMTQENNKLVLEAANQSPVTLGAANVVLHCVEVDNPHALYTIVDQAIWLLAKDGSAKEVEVVLHPLFRLSRPPLDLLGFLAKHRKKVLAMLRARFVSAMNSLVHSHVSGSVLGDPERSPSRRTHDTADCSLFELVIMGEPVEIPTRIGTIRVRRSQPRRAFWSQLRYLSPLFYWSVWKSWRGLHINGRLDPNRLFETKYRSIPVGDLIGSHALRYYPEAGGSIAHSRGIWPTFYRAMAICDYIARSFPGDCCGAVVTYAEQTYLDAIYFRALPLHGVYAYERMDYMQGYKLYPPGESAPNPRVSTSRTTEPISFREREKVFSYLAGRLRSPEKYLTYLFNGKNSEDIRILDDQGGVAYPSPNGANVVLFLHSFEDGQFMFGLDGFADLYDWVEFTLDRLVQNRSVARIFIKGHPNAAPEKMLGDATALRRLKEKYSKIRKCCFLKSTVGPRAFSAADGSFVGVTHHGSVAEELVYLRIPVVASSSARWGQEYKFAELWRTPLEYRLILDSIDSLKSSWDQEFRMSELISFVIDYRLRSWNRDASYVWRKFLISNGMKASISRENYLAADARMRRLSLNDGELIAFIERLVDDHSNQSLPNQLR